MNIRIFGEPKKFLIPLLCLIALAVPQVSHAIIGTGIFDYFSSSLEGVEEVAGPAAAKIISFFFTYVTAVVFLAVSAQLLTITSDPNLLRLGDDMVQRGWHFMAGLVNMAIIFILIYIAVSFILKSENYPLKKTLPQLLIVALLTNFSLVFVGIVVDISNIVNNTFLGGSQNLPFLVIQKLGISVWNTMLALSSALTGIIITYSIPFSAPFAQIATAFSILGVLALLPNFMVWAFQLIGSFLIGGVFLTYAVLFAARIFIIKILAVLSPLALLATVLPQTKKWWDKWLHTFIEWCFLGTFLFFFMNLGFLAINAILPPGAAAVEGQSPKGFLDLLNFKIADYFLYYFFLTIYLAIVAFMAKKTMPKAANAIIDQATALGKMAWGKGLVPAGKFAFQRMNQFAEGQERRESEIAKRLANKDKLGVFSKARLGVDRMGVRMGKWATKGIEYGDWARGTSVAEENQKALEAETGKIKDVKDPNVLMQKYRGAVSRGNQAAQLACLAAAIEKGKGFKKTFQKELGENDKQRIISSAAFANKTGNKATAERLARGYMHNLKHQDSHRDLLAMGFKYSKQDKAIYGEDNLRGKILAESEGDEIKDYKIEALLNEKGEINKTIIDNWDERRISKAAEEFESDFSDSYSEGLREKGGIDYLLKMKKMPVFDTNDNPVLEEDGPNKGEQKIVYRIRNPKAANYLATAPAMSLGIGVAGTPRNYVNNKTASGQILESSPEVARFVEMREAIMETQRKIDRKEPVSVDENNYMEETKKRILDQGKYINSDPRMKGILEAYNKSLTKKEGKRKK